MDVAGVVLGSICFYNTPYTPSAAIHNSRDMFIFLFNKFYRLHNSYMIEWQVVTEDKMWTWCVWIYLRNIVSQFWDKKKNLESGNRHLGLNSKREPNEYEVWVLATIPRIRYEYRKQPKQELTPSVYKMKKEPQNMETLAPNVSLYQTKRHNIR